MNTETALITAPIQDATHPAVSLVTALAETGDLSADEYQEIYERVAAGRSLRNVELALRSGVTFGWWAKYAAGEKHLDRERKNELRAWARANGGPDLPDLPPTPVEAVAAHVHPDAAVYRIGEQIASRVVLVGSDVPAVILRLNGHCALSDNTAVAACTGRYSQQTGPAIHRTRVRYLRPCLSLEPVIRVRQLEELLVAARREVGTGDSAIEAHAGI